MPRKTKESNEKTNILKKASSILKKATEKNEQELNEKSVTPKTKQKKTPSNKNPKKEIDEQTSLKNNKNNKDNKIKQKSSITKESNKTKSEKNSDKKISNTDSPSKISLEEDTLNEDVTPIVKRPTFSPEYYDLPYTYNKTVVKILAQTPTNLFVYWEISKKDREDLKKQYGEYFFEITKPVLIIKNLTMNYAFEIDINDFANSWYIAVNDSNCEYKIELGRRPIPINYNYMPQYNKEKEGPIKPVENEYIYISTSNELAAPNDHVLFNLENKIYFRNIKTNQVIKKDISEFPFVANNSEFSNIYDVYKYLFKEDFVQDRLIRLTNPSSGTGIPGSGEFLSSR